MKIELNFEEKKRIKRRDHSSYLFRPTILSCYYKHVTNTDRQMEQNRKGGYVNIRSRYMQYQCSTCSTNRES